MNIYILTSIIDNDICAQYTFTDECEAKETYNKMTDSYRPRMKRPRENRYNGGLYYDTYDYSFSGGVYKDVNNQPCYYRLKIRLTTRSIDAYKK